MRYFAYGSNMDPVQMAERTPGARALGAARLDGYRLTFTRDSPAWGGGVGHIDVDPDDHVWGVLWELEPHHLDALDVYESVELGVYTRECATVRHDGGEVEAQVYIAVKTDFKKPSKRYMGALIRGAVAHDLPGDYIERLRAIET
ncbi:MAG: gamma-glutamylcyclotransferase family protein [Actinomycetota bacterium]